MSTSTDSTGNRGDQRKDLEESLDKATAGQPETFRDEATDDKVVEIGPDKTRSPIKGIDAPERPQGGR
jgi:hypothetical protein